MAFYDHQGILGGYSSLGEEAPPHGQIPHGLFLVAAQLKLSSNSVFVFYKLNRSGMPVKHPPGNQEVGGSNPAAVMSR